MVALVIALWLLRTPVNWAGGKLALAFGGGVHDLVDLPLLQKFPGFQYMKLDWPEFAGLFGVHLELTAESVLIALLFAIPVGVIVHRIRRLYLPTFALLDAIYAIPSLAVFPILIQIPALGISNTTAIVVVVAYAQFILVRNVFAGLDTVPPGVKEAARGMGMSRLQILLRIELPLALPVILAGTRIATVAIIGIASIGALTGIPNLGALFINAVRNGGVNAYAEVEAGAVGVVALAFAADLILRLIERYIPANRVYRAKTISA